MTLSTYAYCVYQCPVLRTISLSLALFIKLQVVTVTGPKGGSSFIRGLDKNSEKNIEGAYIFLVFVLNEPAASHRPTTATHDREVRDCLEQKTNAKELGLHAIQTELACTSVSLDWVLITFGIRC